MESASKPSQGYAFSILFIIAIHCNRFTSVESNHLKSVSFNNLDIESSRACYQYNGYQDEICKTTACIKFSVLYHFSIVTCDILSE